MPEIKIKSYNYPQGPDTPRNPLGGREADGFGDWLTTTYLRMRDLRNRFTRPEDDSVPAKLSQEAVAQYGKIRNLWLATMDGSRHFPRDVLEVTLITEVMTGYALATYALECKKAGEEDQPGRREFALMSAEYLRAALILAAYTGAPYADIAACNGDQEKLSALRG